MRRMSDEAHADVDGSIDLLYVDGAHRYGPARDDIAAWGARVPLGGTLLVHDAYNAIGVMLAQLRLLFFSGRWRYVGRTRSLAQYRRENLSAGPRAANAAAPGRSPALLHPQRPDQGRARRTSAPGRPTARPARRGCLALLAGPPGGPR